MEIGYKRELEKSYMIIRQSKKEWEDFEIQMFLNNKIDGMLPFFFVAEDGVVKFVYDITGKQSLATYLKSRRMGYALLEALVESIKKVNGSIQDYLLNENALFISMDTIFVSHDGSRLYYCYLPGYTRLVNEALVELMEQLLAQIGAGESELLGYAHEIYQKLLAEDYKGLSKLCAVQEENNGWQQGARKTEQHSRERDQEHKEEHWDEENNDTLCAKEEAKHVKTHGKKRGRKIEKNGLDELKMEKIKEGKRQERTEGGKPSVIQNVKNKVLDSLKGFSKKAENGMPFLEEDYFQASFDPDRGFVAEEFVHPTVYIGDDAVAGIGLLKSERGGIENFDLTVEETLIGKPGNEVDICLNDDTVSRIHALVQKKEDGYYIEDLNSTNGTFVNHKQIPYREQVLLHSGDAVSFGLAEFTFY